MTDTTPNLVDDPTTTIELRTKNRTIICTFAWIPNEKQTDKAIKRMILLSERPFS